MWLLANDLPIRLEALDQAGHPIVDVSARLQHLDAEHALITMEAGTPTTCFHWGAPVRFNLEDGLRRYEIAGAITGRERKRREGADSSAAASSSGDRGEHAQLVGAGSREGTAVAESPAEEVCELRVRIWDSNMVVQRRTTPRRKLRFPVYMQPLASADSTDKRPTGDLLSGWCMDIGGGGIRIRTPRLETIPDRMLLEFHLPVSSGISGSSRQHKFSLWGRVIRAAVCGRHSDTMEIALHFERLTVADGLVLKTLLS
jgi:hypothetical protein